MTYGAEFWSGIRSIWRRTRGHEDVAIAVLDGPLNWRDPDLDGARLRCVDAVRPCATASAAAASHGTEVARRIFGRSGRETSGVAPDCSGVVVPVFAASSSGRLEPCSQLDLAVGLRLALTSGARVVNVSAGQVSRGESLEPVLASAIDECARRGVLVVCAAGNDGGPILHLPAAHPWVVVVGAADDAGRPLPFSNWHPSYTARGVLAPVAPERGGDAGDSGTSFAAPLVSGFLGLLLSLSPERGRPAAERARAALLEATRTDAGAPRALRGALIPHIALRTITGVEPMNDHESPAPAAELHVPNLPPAHSAEDPPRGHDAPAPRACACHTRAEPSVQPVYALGTLGYDFATEAVRDSFREHVPGALTTEALLAYLDANPWDAPRVTWTLSLNGTVIYAVRPAGAYAALAYDKLRSFLAAQSAGGAERVSVPGVLRGATRLMNGQRVPVIEPELRGLCAWTTAALAAKAAAHTKTPEAHAALENFLARVYHELSNLGITPEERAINYAATNAFQAEAVFSKAAAHAHQLKKIETAPVPFQRPGSECRDVLLHFFNPKNVLGEATTVHRYTIDVSSVIPVAVGEVRSWEAH